MGLKSNSKLIIVFFHLQATEAELAEKFPNILESAARNKNTYKPYSIYLRLISILCPNKLLIYRWKNII